MVRLFTYLFIVALPISWCSFVAAQETVYPGPYIAGAAIEIDDGTEQFFERGEGGWSASFSAPGAASMRLHLVGKAQIVDPVTIRVLNESGVVQDEIEVSSANGDVDLWTIPVLGPRIVLVIDGSRAGARKPDLLVDQMVAELDSAAVESVVGENQLQWIGEYQGPAFDVVSGAQRSIAKLSFMKDDIGYVCTAFMVADDIAMTNEHCVATMEVCRTAVVTFNYQFNNFGYLENGESFKCISVLDQDAKLDFSLLKIDRHPGSRYGKLRFAPAALTENANALIIQHPSGKPKMISILECVVLSDLVRGRDIGTDYKHTCDTEGGSSGSPILSLAGEVIGLHHLGRSKVDSNFEDANRAVAISDILRERLRKDGVK